MDRHAFLLALLFTLTLSSRAAFAGIRIRNSTNRLLTVYVQRENSSKFDKDAFVVPKNESRVLTYRIKGGVTPYPPGRYLLAGKIKGEQWKYTNWRYFGDDEAIFDFFAPDSKSDIPDKYFGV